MTWINRLKLLSGLLVVLVTVAAATIILNQRESQVASSSAYIQALSYSIGSDYPGTVVEQTVKQGDEVVQGQPLMTIQSPALTQALSGHLRRPLRPGDPEHPVGMDRFAELLDPALQLGARRREEENHGCGSGLRDAMRTGRQRIEQCLGAARVADDRERGSLTDPELAGERRPRIAGGGHFARRQPDAGSAASRLIEPSSAIVQ